VVYEEATFSLQAKKGAKTNFYGYMLDITERKQAEEKLRINEERLKSIFSAMSEGFSVQDVITDDAGNPCDLRFVDANPAFELQTGLKNATTLGHTLLELFPTSEKYWIERYGHVGLTGEPIEFEAMFGPLNRYYSVSAFQTKPGQFGTMFRDISDYKLAMEALRASEYFFKESQKAGNIGSYKTDFVSGFWVSSEVLDGIFGIDKNYQRTVTGWIDIVHPDDREMITQYLNERVIAKREPFDKQYRIIRKSDQQVRWVHGLGQVTFDPDGKIIISMTGTIQDITESRLTTEALQESEERHRAIMESANDAMVCVDSKGEIYM
jgi:PAS domain-containing protein